MRLSKPAKGGSKSLVGMGAAESLGPGNPDFGFLAWNSLPLFNCHSTDVLDFRSDLGRLLQHGRDRTVLFLREPHCVLNRLLLHLTTHCIDQLDSLINGGWFFGALSLGSYREAGERVSFLIEDG